MATTTRGSAFDLMVASVAFVGDDDARGRARVRRADVTSRFAAPPVVVVAPADPTVVRVGARERRQASFRRAASGAASDDPEYGLFDALRAVASLERASDAPFRAPPRRRGGGRRRPDAGAADASGCSRIFALGTVFEEEEDAFEEKDDALEEEDANARDGGGSRRGFRRFRRRFLRRRRFPGDARVRRAGRRRSREEAAVSRC